jgi:hypothetical protein
MPSDILIGDDILEVTPAPQETVPAVDSGTPESVSEHLLLLLDTFVSLVHSPTPEQIDALSFALSMPVEDLTRLIDSMLVAGDDFGNVQTVIAEDPVEGFDIEEPMEFFVEADVQEDVDKEIEVEDDELVEELEVDGEDDGEDQIDEFSQDGISDPARKEPTGDAA